MQTREAPSGWAIGWTTFAGVMMILGGGWWIMSGLVAIFDDEFFVATRNFIFEFDVTAWGWIHLIVGVVVLCAGFALFSAAVWARTVGVIIAVLAALVAFAWLPYYPIWAIIFIAVSFAVIWALTAHGDDITAAQLAGALIVVIPGIAADLVLDLGDRGRRPIAGTMTASGDGHG